MAIIIFTYLLYDNTIPINIVIFSKKFTLTNHKNCFQLIKYENQFKGANNLKFGKYISLLISSFAFILLMFIIVALLPS